MVAMSGGVDSSAAALLLKQEGWTVSGAELILWKDERPTDNNSATGPSFQAWEAREIATHLGIPFYSFDLQGEFKKHVVDPFCQEYLEARTPNPCVHCNQRIKFGLLMELAKSLDTDYLATGHYARIEEDSRYSGPVLKKGLDPQKDQSYALFALPKEQLEHILFPMGSYTKRQARELLKEAGLHGKVKPESQDICFLPQGDYGRFIASRFPDRNNEGPIVNRRDEVLGKHQGLFRYTIGQRRGLGIAAKKPYYVLQLRPADNTLVVGFSEEVLRREFEVSGVNWLIPPSGPSLRTCVKIRYNTEESPAEVVPLTGHRVRVRFENPQKAITPGQVAVFYQDEIVLGGGWIEGP